MNRCSHNSNDRRANKPFQALQCCTTFLLPSSSPLSSTCRDLGETLKPGWKTTVVSPSALPVRVWNSITVSYEVLQTYGRHLDQVCWSSNGQHVAALDCMGRFVTVWNASSGDIVETKDTSIENVFPPLGFVGPKEEEKTVDSRIVGVDCERFTVCGDRAAGVWNKRHVLLFRLIQTQTHQKYVYI